MKTDTPRLIISWSLIVLFGIVTVLGLVTTTVKLFTYRRECENSLNRAHDYIEHNCMSVRKMVAMRDQLECIRRQTIIESMEDEKTGTRYVWSCAWNNVMEDFGWCTSEGCSSTWKFGAFRMFTLGIALVVVAYSAIYFLVWLERKTEQSNDARLYSLPTKAALDDETTYHQHTICMDKPKYA